MIRLAFALLAACLWAAAGGAAHARGASRIVVVGDVHGAYAQLLGLLVAAGIADSGGHWAGGDATLVQLGDLLDRGPDERRVLDLLMALEREAASQGGAVVVVLGNHEIMSMVGDWRYAAPAAIADFGGAAARRAALGPDGKYGRWLRKRPAIVAIDGNVFVHGGVTQELTQLGLRGIRNRARDELKRVDAARARAVREGALDDGADLDALLALRLPQLADYASWLISHAEGPFWFRGFAEWTDAELGAQLPGTLQALKAERFVVGHSVRLPAAIGVRANGQILIVDTGMLGAPSYPGGAALALEIRGAARGRRGPKAFTTIDAAGGRTPLPIAAPARK